MTWTELTVTRVYEVINLHSGNASHCQCAHIGGTVNEDSEDDSEDRKEKCSDHRGCLVEGVEEIQTYNCALGSVFFSKDA